MYTLTENENSSQYQNLLLRKTVRQAIYIISYTCYLQQPCRFGLKYFSKDIKKHVVHILILTANGFTKPYILTKSACNSSLLPGSCTAFLIFWIAASVSPSLNSAMAYPPSASASFASNFIAFALSFLQVS